jgi:subtilisin family serine protease
MSQDRLADVIRFFFDRALPQATNGKHLADLANASVHVGSYRRAQAAAATTTPFGDVTLRYTLSVAPQALPTVGGIPNPAGTTVGAGASPVPLVWIRHVADVAADSEDEIRRVMADYDTYASSPWATSGAAAGTSPASAQTWAHAIATMPQPQRDALKARLADIATVPQPLATLAPDVEALRDTLAHFFTYDAQGAYYAKWSGAGRDFQAAQLTTPYKTENLRELRLQRNHYYLYAVVPQGLFAGESGQSGTFREIIVRFDETGVDDLPFRLATVHTVRRQINAAPYHDFVFFYAEEGEGIAVSADVLARISAPLRFFLDALAEATDANAFYASNPTVSTGSGSVQVHLTVTLSAATTLPDYVVDNNEPGLLVRHVLVPPDKVLDLAAVPNVVNLEPLMPNASTNDLARAQVHSDALLAAMPADKRGGAGVLVGIIDTGIDGSHPAFAGRIVAVWDQADPPIVAGRSPAARHQTDPLKSKYAAFNWGVELEASATTDAEKPSHSLDPEGHGTHVAGIIAGQEVRDGAGNVLMHAGVAPNAKIAMVRTIGLPVTAATHFYGDTTLAMRWLFQKADELGLPLVVNMSFGSMYNAHDGSDPQSQSFFRLVRNPANTAYLPGRVLVASAGNYRTDKYHVKRTLAPFAMNPLNMGFTSFTVRLNSQAGTPAARKFGETVTIWIKNPTGVCNIRYPVMCWAFRRANPLASTQAIVLGGTTPIATFPGLNLRVGLTSQPSAPVNGDFNFDVSFQSTNNNPMAPDDWTIVLFNNSGRPLEMHAWTSAFISEFTDAPTPDDAKYKIGSPAVGAAVVSVASCTSRLNWTDETGTALHYTADTALKEISSFSSPGPLRESGIPPATMFGVTHEIRGIDVTAPGQGLISARSHQSTPTPGFGINAEAVLMQGTSMASPVVTGLIANLLAEAHNLTVSDVLNRLQRAAAIPTTSTHQPPSGSHYSDDWGWGLVDAPLLRT